MRSFALSLLLACTASLASCVTVVRDGENAAWIKDLHLTRLGVVAIEPGLSFSPSPRQVARDFRTDGGESQWDETDFLLPFGPSDFIDFFFRDGILYPMPPAKGVKHPFKCRITPIETSARQQQWRIFPCDSGLSLFMVSGAGESTAPIYFLVSGYEPEDNSPSDLLGLPAVHIVEILNGDISAQIERVVRSAQALWDFFGVLLVLLVPGLFLLAVLAFMLLMPPNLRLRRAIGVRVAAST